MLILSQLGPWLKYTSFCSALLSHTYNRYDSMWYHKSSDRAEELILSHTPSAKHIQLIYIPDPMAMFCTEKPPLIFVNWLPSSIIVLSLTNLTFFSEFHTQFPFNTSLSKCEPFTCYSHKAEQPWAGRLFLLGKLEGTDNFFLFIDKCIKKRLRISVPRHLLMLAASQAAWHGCKPLCVAHSQLACHLQGYRIPHPLP